MWKEEKNIILSQERRSEQYSVFVYNAVCSPTHCLKKLLNEQIVAESKITLHTTLNKPFPDMVLAASFWRNAYLISFLQIEIC